MHQPLASPSLPCPAPPAGPAAAGFSAARSAASAQRGWAATSLDRRIELLRAFRALLAEHGTSLAKSSAEPRQRPLEECLTAEVIPLADACQFLEREAGRILAPRKLGRTGRPLWLRAVTTEVRREPLGVILVIAPSNYPLFIPGVQVLQALTAGNAVLLKPGANGTRAAHALADLLYQAGFDPRLLHVLPEPPEAARGAVEGGVAKVYLTGSATTGAAVQAELAPRLIPSTMELSGCDAVLVRADADLELTVRALGFGLRLNQGATCMAPRRIFVHRSVATELEGRLAAALTSAPVRSPVSRQSATVPDPEPAEAGTPDKPLRLNSIVSDALHDALARGAHLLSGKLLSNGDCLTPLVVAGASSSMQLLHEDVFAPVMSLVTVADDIEAIEMSRQCPYALAATIFTRDEQAARQLAGQLHAGLVIVNDMIVPSADPRIPFGGRGHSGFGVTRGPEGLLEMTVPKVVTIRHTRLLPHLDPPTPGDAALFQEFLMAVHGRGLLKRLKAIKNAFRLVRLRRTGRHAARNHRPALQSSSTP